MTRGTCTSLPPRQTKENARPQLPADGRALCSGGISYRRSTIVTLARPPPSHIVCRPHFLLRSFRPYSSVVISLVPEAPSGWPSAIAPPLTFRREGSAPVY